MGFKRADDLLLVVGFPFLGFWEAVGFRWGASANNPERLKDSSSSSSGSSLKRSLASGVPSERSFFSDFGGSSPADAIGSSLGD